MSWLQLGHYMCHSIRRGVRVWVHVQVFDDACVFVRWSMLPVATHRNRKRAIT